MHVEDVHGLPCRTLLSRLSVLRFASAFRFLFLYIASGSYLLSLLAQVPHRIERVTHRTIPVKGLRRVCLLSLSV